MIIPEQIKTKEASYTEAMRYMDNDKDTLQKAGKDGNYYQDVKYVKTACGTAYNAVLIAMDCLFILKGIKVKKQRKSIDYYRQNTAKVDHKAMDILNTAYTVLNLEGYYDGVKSVKIIQCGFEKAYELI